jgi:hypothetical protein
MRKEKAMLQQELAQAWRQKQTQAHNFVLG